MDFSAITSGANRVNNFAGGLLKATEADAVRPGVGGVVNNSGTILSVTTTGSSSDGVDAQNNTGVQVNNSTMGIIEGGRHGITGGALTSSGLFTTSVTNNGIIKGDNGSGINLDGFNANEMATIVNTGTITGNGISGDGDGIDVDGVVNITNSGTVRSLNAFSSTSVAQSEGVTVGGGTIINSGTIEGDVASGNTNAVGRGIGGGTVNAAIKTGADNDTIVNAGIMDGSSSGKAIDMGAGNNTLQIVGGAASVLGNISGGVGGTNTMTISPGAVKR